MTYSGSAAAAGRGSQFNRDTSNNFAGTYATISEVRKVGQPGSKADFEDVTNFQSGNYREYIPTLLDSGEVEIEGNFIPADPQQLALAADFDSQTLRQYQLILPQAGADVTFVFKAYVAAKPFPIVEVDKAQKFTVKLKITGAWTVS